MISKNRFVEIINQVIEFHKAERQLNDIIRVFCSDCSSTCFDRYEAIVFDLLQDIFEDNEKDWIGYALYELDDFKRGDKYVKIDGESVWFRNAEDLYDVLINEMNIHKENNNND